MTLTADFDFTLLDFQLEDVEQTHTKRARLIANDPGTGKTYEGIALDLLNRQGIGNAKVDLKELFPSGKMKTLIVCPKSVVGSWEEHCEKLTGEDVYVVPGKAQDRKGHAAFLKAILDPRTSGYFIVNWEYVRMKREELKKVYWLHIIADECHKAKNRKSQQTLALKVQRTVYKTAMSGTPADNAPEDLWSILNWLWPNYYTSFWKFVNAYCDIQTHDPKTGQELGYRKVVGVNEDNIQKLHEEMEPWYVRRLKQDVLKDLPDKYYTKIWVDLDAKQRKAYEQMRKTMMAWVSEHEEEIDNNPVMAQAVVSQLVRLQQYADAYLVPRLDANGEHLWKWKWKYPKKGMPRAEQNAWRKEHQDDPESGGAVKVFLYDMIDPSSKLDALQEWMEDRPDEPLVIFSQYKSVIKLLEHRLRKAEVAYRLCTGDVTGEDRTRGVKDFQEARARVFAGTIAAGGVGITLTRASTAAFIDRSWSPAINGQAEDRTHRIGQTQAVEVIDFMARNTVDLGKHQKLAVKGIWLKKILGDQVDIDAVLADLETTGASEAEQYIQQEVDKE
jgi:SNF2 family DNA or RNA helicase